MESLIGKTIVGYRYGEAPESGFSWNYAENRPECGVSMAKIDYMKETGSFAVADAGCNRKKYYYVGQIAGEGGDDEVCLTNVRRINYKEYLKLLKETKEVSNEYVNAFYDRKLRLLTKGYAVSMTEEEIEKERKQYLRK